MPSFISVVIPVRNEEATIAGVIQALQQQEYPADRFEILVCDGLSEDRTVEVVRAIAAQDGRVRLLTNERQWSSAGRNVGYRHARGDIILFVDGHCVVPDSHLLSAAAELFSATGADCLCRPQPLVPDTQQSAWTAAIAAVRASRLGHSRSSYIYSDYEGPVSPISAGAAYTRRVFETIGEYDESFDACEDVEFNVRVEKAGFKSYISPRLAVYYQARRGPLGLYRQMHRYGQGRFRLLRKHPDCFEWQVLAPALFVMIFLFAVLAIILIPPLRPLLAASVLLATALFYAATIHGGKRFGYRGWPLYPFVLVIIYSGLGVGFIQAAVVDGLADATHVGPDRERKQRTLRSSRPD